MEDGLWAHLRPGSTKDNFASTETGTGTPEWMRSVVWALPKIWSATIEFSIIFSLFRSLLIGHLLQTHWQTCLDKLLGEEFVFPSFVFSRVGCIKYLLLCHQLSSFRSGLVLGYCLFFMCCLYRRRRQYEIQLRCLYVCLSVCDNVL